MPTYSGRVQNKKDSEANWIQNNPIILDGELIVVETENGELRKKIGDGTSHFSELPFDDEIMRSLIYDLEKRVFNLEYLPIYVEQFAVINSVIEIGSVVDSVSLSYSLSKAPVMLTLDDEAVTPIEQAGTITKTGLVLTEDKTWTLIATDEQETTASKTAALRFYNGVYYGASPDGWEGLTKTLTNSRGRTFTVDAGAGEYIWYALPKRLGAPTFTVGGFEGGFELREETEYTNPSGYTETYAVYRSTNAGLGNTTVTVS